MRINNQNNNVFTFANKAYTKTQKVESVEKIDTMEKRDELHISEEAKLMLEKSKATRTPERQAKIDSLKEAVQNGTYNPDNRLVADVVFKALS